MAQPARNGPARQIRWGRALRLVPLVCGAVMGSGALLRAETVSPPVLTAAFLLNFAKFVEWPAETLSPGDHLSLCVVGDRAVADALELTIKGHAIDRHPLTVQIVKPEGPFGVCRLLYIGGRDGKRALLALDTVRGAPIFSVGEADGFAEAGGVAQLILENDRMRFAINVVAAQRARLQLSSKLLSLATLVKDRETVNAAR